MDELNYFEKEIVERNIQPIKKYFAEMELTDEQRKDREDLANELEKIMLFILALILIQKEQEAINRDYIISQFEIKFKNAIGIDVIDDYLDLLITNTTTDIVDTTLSHIADEEDLDTEIGNENWWVSKDRALFLAEDNSNAVCNYTEYAKAIENGAKYKVWRTEKDNRVRKNHKALNGVKKPINELFVVGDSLMRFPKDLEFFPSVREFCNCRCTIEYK